MFLLLPEKKSQLCCEKKIRFTVEFGGPWEYQRGPTGIPAGRDTAFKAGAHGNTSGGPREYRQSESRLTELSSCELYTRMLKVYRRMYYRRIGQAAPPFTCRKLLQKKQLQIFLGRLKK